MWPEWLGLDLPPGLPIPKQQWQGTLYAAFIMGAPDSTRIMSGACTDLLGITGDPDDSKLGNCQGLT